MDFHWGLNACSRAQTGGNSGKIYTAIFRAMNLTHSTNASAVHGREPAKPPSSCCNFQQSTDKTTGDVVSLGFRVEEILEASSSSVAVSIKTSPIPTMYLLLPQRCGGCKMR